MKSEKQALKRIRNKLVHSASEFFVSRPAYQQVVPLEALLANRVFREGSAVLEGSVVLSRLESLALASGGITTAEVMDRALKLYEKTLEEAEKGNVINYVPENINLNSHPQSCQNPQTSDPTIS
jgi:hypothetical protein